MVKLYENTFRAVNIALAFELAEACQSYGLDVAEVTEGAASKPYGFMAHQPSAGVGGHGIAVDPQYLAHPLRERERTAIVAEAALRKIAGRPRHIVCRAQEMLDEAGGSLARARVLIVGASYKPGVADTHESPAHEIARLLLREGAEVDYHDPLVASIRVGERTLRSVTPDPRVVDPSGFGPEDYDLTIVVTVHPEHDLRLAGALPGGARLHVRNPRRPSPRRAVGDQASLAAEDQAEARTQGAWRTDRRSTGSTIGQHASDRGRRSAKRPRPSGHLIKSISWYLGSGHRSSATSFSSRSATSRTSSIAGMTVSRM